MFVTIHVSLTHYIPTFVQVSKLNIIAKMNNDGKHEKTEPDR